MSNFIPFVNSQEEVAINGHTLMFCMTAWSGSTRKIKIVIIKLSFQHRADMKRQKEEDFTIKIATSPFRVAALYSDNWQCKSVRIHF